MHGKNLVDLFNVSGEVAISAAGLRRVRQGHLWIYSSDVTRDDAHPGETFVKVSDPAHKTLGYAFHSPSSQIRLRLFTRNEELPSLDLLRARIEAAIRRRPGVKPRAACRLIFGEADLLPSIIVDRYADYLVIQTLSRGAENLKPVIVDILRNLIPSTLGIVERNDVRARILEGLEPRKGVLWGDPPEGVEIVEGGLRFLVDLSAGQKTGFFLDQSENRLAGACYASGRVLDCFTNTGAFALQFAARAASVIGVDSSRESLQQARRNAELNALDNLEFREANVFDVLRELDRTQERFDLVCLDPPAFAKNRGAIAAAKACYKEINLRAMKILGPDGILVTSSCSYHLSEPDFLDLIRQAAHDAHRYVQVLERRSQAHDHPILATMPETHYLKCLILRVL
jgi:23S rRNA (cytosine1962-C5)-methyltransferase